MYSIGQVSKNTNVTVSALRYYDEIGLLKPAKVYGLDNQVMDYIDNIVDLYLIHLQEEMSTNGKEYKNN